MKLRNFDNFLLKEAEESDSHAEAAKLGLQYQGFGYYNDPRTGQITHKSEGGKLVPYSGPDSRPVEASGNAPDVLKNKNAKGDESGAPKMAPGSGIAKAPDPGKEQHPRGANWTPGPDGDDCVNDQPPPTDLAFDTFVGKTNYYKWTAGSDGSNFTNIKVSTLLNEPPAKREAFEHSFFTFLKEGPMVASEKGNPTPGGDQGMSPSEKAKQMGLQSDGHGSWRDQQGNIVARTVNGELVFYEPGGGAVSDSGGGSDLAMAKPTWSDPVTGMAITPPSKPETPEEIAAVPAATPAQAPAGYERFMQQRKEDLYKDQALNDTAQQEIEQQKNPALEDMSQYPELAMKHRGLEIQAEKFGQAAEEAEQMGDEKASSKARKAQINLSYAVNKFVEDFADFEEQHRHMGDEFITKLGEQEILMNFYMSKKAPLEQKYEQISEMEKTGKVTKEVAAALKAKCNEVINNQQPPGLDLGERAKMRRLSNESRPKPSQQIEGNMTTYNLTSEYDKFDAKSDARVDEVANAFSKQLSKFNIDTGDVSDVIEISWDTNPGVDKKDPGNRKRAAFDALKTWRSQVLPSLDPGTIVFNNPITTGSDEGSDQGIRERIYSLAGFGDMAKKGKLEGQYGVVVPENGQNTIKPLNLGSGSKSKARKKKLKEELVAMIDATYGSSLNILRKIQLVEEYYEVS